MSGRSNSRAKRLDAPLQRPGESEEDFGHRLDEHREQLRTEARIRSEQGVESPLEKFARVWHG